jgi:predicted NBD/HSP70 family sugar kinase
MVMPVSVRADETGTPGSMTDVRRSNLALVLGRIADASAGIHPSRAQVATSTGLTKASVSSLVQDLLEAGLVREVGPSQTARGRPGVGLELNPARAVMGMEINVDYIAAGVVDLSGVLLTQEFQEFDNRGRGSAPTLAALARLAARVRNTARERGVQVLGGGLAVPGLVDPAAARILTAPNLGWSNIDLDFGALLPEVPLGVALFNEANAAAMAELRYRPDGRSNFLFVSGEVGVGGGLVIESELFTGPEGHAGEVGHVVVDPGGAECSCGSTGCLETVAGQDTIIAAAGLAINTGDRTNAMSTLLQALAAEDPAALQAVVRAAWYLGVALASTARIVDISSLILGGHFATLERWLRSPLLESLEKYAPGRFSPSCVTTAAAGQQGALLGAAGGMVRSLVEAPHRLQ